MRYPTKKQSFYNEKDCFLLGTSNFFAPSYFETALVISKVLHILGFQPKTSKVFLKLGQNNFGLKT